MSKDSFEGREFGPYKIDKQLGAGGMGVVYAATELKLDRPVALKVLAPHLLEDPTARSRFYSEIQVATKLEHRNIVPVFNAGIEEDQFFIAMRMVNGPNLADLMHECGPIEPRRAIRLFKQASNALAYVHRRDFIHRDVKPQNILVCDEGGPGEYVLLTDFGIARALDSPTGLTKGPLGTSEYLAPEVLDWQDATPASDQYSLGCVLFEMLASQHPYRDSNSRAPQLTEPVPNVCAFATGLPASLGAAIERSMAREPKSRFASVQEFSDAVSLSETRTLRRATVFGEIRTVDDFRGMKMNGEGLVVITDMAKANPTTHRPTCDYVQEVYFQKKVIQGSGKNGRYYLVPDFVTAETEWRAAPCPSCEPEGSDNSGAGAGVSAADSGPTSNRLDAAADNGSVGIGVFAVRELDTDRSHVGQPPGGNTERTGRARKFRVTGPDDLDLLVADIVWENGERNLETMECGDSPRRFDCLRKALRLSVLTKGEKKYVELRQARMKDEHSSSLFNATLEQLSSALGAEIVAAMNTLGASDVGTRAKVLHDSGPAKDRLCATIGDEGDLVPVGAYVVTRVAPIQARIHV